MKKIFLLLIAALSLMTACKDDSLKERETIMEFIAANNFTADETELGTFIVTQTEGTGVSPTSADNVEVRYTGSYLDGEVFDSSPDGDTVEFGMNQVIRGFSDGLAQMKEGGSAKLIIPSDLGYGSNPPGGIRRNAVLVFDVELVTVL